MKQSQIKQNKRLGLIMAAMVAFMVLMSFAAVPLYDLFCRVTGFSGANIVSSVTDIDDLEAGSKSYIVKFNADTMPNLPWKFKAQQRKVETLSGIRNLVFYEAKNTSDITTTGTAIFNILPAPAAKYFSKIECFCFAEQSLKPGQEQIFPVSFYIDPEIVNDPLLKNLDTVTLSYSFFAAKKKN